MHVFGGNEHHIGTTKNRAIFYSYLIGLIAVCIPWPPVLARFLKSIGNYVFRDCLLCWCLAMYCFDMYLTYVSMDTINKAQCYYTEQFLGEFACGFLQTLFHTLFVLVPDFYILSSWHRILFEMRWSRNIRMLQYLAHVGTSCCFSMENISLDFN